MKRYNKKLLALAMAGSILMTSGCWNSSPDDTIRETLTHIESGKIRAAEISAKGLLQEAQQEQNAEVQRAARLLLARIYYEAGDNQNATRFFDALPTPIAADASQATASIKATDEDWHHWILSAWTSGDRRQAGEILDNEKAPFSDSARDIYKIRQLFAEDRASEAMTVLELTDAPQSSQSPYVRYQYAQLTTALDNARSRALTDDIIASAPEFASAYLLRGRLRLGESDNRGAIEDLLRYTELRPRDHNTKIMTALAAFQVGESDAAEGLVKNLAKVAPSHPAVLQLRAMSALKNQEIAKAGEFAEESFGMGNEAFINRLIIGVSAYQSQRWELANRHLSAINDKLPSNHFARKMLVEVKLQLDDSAQAATIFEDIDTNSMMDVALANRLSAKLIQSGGFQAASAIQKQVSDIEIEEDKLLQQRQILSQALKRNEFKQALIESVKDQNTEDKDKLRLTLLYLADGETDKARSLAEEWLKSASDNVNALNASAIVALQEGNNSRVRTYLDKALAKDPDNIPSLIMQANILRTDNDWQRVLETSDHLINRLNFVNPAVFAYWLESSLRLQKDTDQKALQLVAADERNLLEGTYLNFLLQSRQFDKVLSYLDGYEGDWSLRHYASAVLSGIQRGDREAAATHLSKLLQSDLYDDQKTALFVASSAARIEQYELVLEALKKAENSQIIVPNSELMAATALIRLGKLKDAEARLTLRANRDAGYYDVMAELQIAKEDWRGAWTSLQSASEDQLTPARLVRMHQVGTRINQLTSVKSSIRNYFKNNTGDVGARRLLSQPYLESDPRFAIELLDDPSMAEALEKDWVSTNNLAWLYHQTGNTEKARQYAEHAIAHAPDRPEVIDTYETIFGHKPGA